MTISSSSSSWNKYEISSHIIVGIVSCLWLSSYVLYVSICTFYQHQRQCQRKTVAKEPPFVRSWIPYIGSAIEMNQMTPRRFIQTYCHRNQSPIFTATIAGTSCHFIGDPIMANIVYEKPHKILDPAVLHQGFLIHVMGIPPTQLQEFYTDPVAVKGIQTVHHHYLLSKEALADTIQDVQRRLNVIFQQWMMTTNTTTNTPTTTNTSTTTNTTDSTASTTSWTECSLLQWVTEAIYVATTGSLVSDHLANHEYISTFQLFNQGIALAMAKIPQWLLLRDFRHARERLITAMGSHNQSTLRPLMKARWDELLLLSTSTSSSSLRTTNAKTHRHPHLAPESVTRANMAVWWASLGNSIPAIFWSILNLLHHPDAYHAVQTEVDTIVRQHEEEEKMKKKKHHTKDETTNDHDSSSSSICFTLEQLDKMVCLRSVFMETLRLESGGFTPRDVQQDIIVTHTTDNTQYLLRKGTRIMGYGQIIHMDPEIYPNPETFQWDRFLPKTNDSSSSSSSSTTSVRTTFTHKNGKTIDAWKAFGGGAHLCPGRKFIGYEAQAYLAMIIRQLDIRLKQGETIPGIHPKMTGVGVNHPATDVKVEMRRRT